MNKTILKLVFTLFILSCLGFLAYRVYEKYYFTAVLQPSEYVESPQELENPYQGFYRLYGYFLSDEVPIKKSAVEGVISEDLDTQLVLILINLKYYRLDAISDSGLQQLKDVLDAWSNSGKQIILRFVYDWDGKGQSSEPEDIQTIFTHMEQVAPYVNEHKNHIFILQGCFLGSYGEMHSSNYMTDANLHLLYDCLNSSIDPSIYLAVRTPNQWRIVAGSDTPVSREDAFGSTLAARLSLYNDGLLGSGSDVGTYQVPREEEVAFQQLLCRYVPNGGEVIIDNPYNDFESAKSDFAHMHISYLNRLYDPAVFKKWSTTTYQGKDVFDGVDGFTYISRHLGYRYVLRSTVLTFDPFRDESALYTLSLENVGFSNSYRNFPLSLTIRHKDTGQEYLLSPDTDTRFFQSGEITDFSVLLDIREMGIGSYDIYLKLTDPATDKAILLANTMTLTEDGYHLGNIVISK